MSMKPLRPMKEVLREWLPELSEKLGRSVEELGQRGLSAYDFSSADAVEIRYPYGHVHRINFAFAVVRPKDALAAVFSEHAGYVEFELIEDCIVAEIHDEIVYRHEPDEVDS